MSLTYEIGSTTVEDILLKWKNGIIDTSPAFQRHSVWKKADRLKLINSINDNKPIPSIFLYKRENANGESIYDVIDGKQRLETIIKYVEAKSLKNMEFIEGKFKQDSVFIDIPKYSLLAGDKKRKILDYKIAEIKVAGEYSDILDLFININSLGEPLKKIEIKNAKYNQSSWIKYVNDLVKNTATSKKLSLINEMFKKPNGIDRMAKEQFLLEILLTVFEEEIQDGKTVLDRILSDKAKRLSTKKKKEFLQTIDWMNSIFTIENIKSSRLKNKTDFYSVFFILSQYVRKMIVTKDQKTNQIIKEIILAFLAIVDESIHGIKINNEMV